MQRTHMYWIRAENVQVYSRFFRHFLLLLSFAIFIFVKCVQRQSRIRDQLLLSIVPC